MARYRLATVTGFTDQPVKVSFDAESDPLLYIDPATDKQMLLGGSTKKRITGTIESETDVSSKWDTEATTVAFVFQDAAGASDLTKTTPKILYHKVSMATGVEDTGPARQVVGFTAEPWS